MERAIWCASAVSRAITGLKYGVQAVRSDSEIVVVLVEASALQAVMVSQLVEVSVVYVEAGVTMVE